MRELRGLVLTISTLFLLGACGGTVPHVGYSDTIASVVVKNYGFLDRDTLRRFNPLGNDLTNNRIELAVEKSFTRRGYHYVKEPRDADILVSYFVLGFDKQYLIDYNRGVKPCARCPMAETLKRGVLQYERGTVIIDFLDPETQRSVWRGTLEKMIKSDQSPSDRNENIKRAVDEILAQYPPT